MKKYIAFIIGFILPILMFTSCQEEKPLFFVTTSVSPEGAGSVSPSSSEVTKGSSITFRATANENYIFAGWSGGISGTENPITTIVTSDINVNANFILRTYPLSLTVEGDGSISEKVIFSQTEYNAGTVVELTAVPEQHWQFSHWEGDFSGSENPKQITISSAKSIKAVFTKMSYDYNLNIVGPGAVDEEIVQQTRATLEARTIVRLSAYPDGRTNAVFKGWSGDVTGTDPVIEVNIDDVKNITATFGPAPAKQYPLPDLLLPTSYRKDLFYGIDFRNFSWYSTGFLPVDYNRDGYIDVINFNTTYSYRQSNVGFYLGQSDGTFIEDINNSNKFLSPIMIRKSFYSDFNNDGYIDIALIGHGLEGEGIINTGESPIIMFGNSNGIFKYQLLSDIVGYYHGSCAGDIDNDGDIDIVLIEDAPNLGVLVNNGNGFFEFDNRYLNESIINGSMCTCELYDLNKDGYLDLIVGGHEHEDPTFENWGKYVNTTCVFWGNGKSFNNNNYTKLPRFIDGFGVTLDYLFFDLNNDGYAEIINTRTGDGMFNLPGYQGWAIQVVSYDGKNFIDITDDVIDCNIDSESRANIWINIEEIDDVKYIVGRKDDEVNAFKMFKIVGNKLYRFNEESNDQTLTKIEHGFALYSDFAQFPDMDYNPFPHLDVQCADNPISGTKCIKVHDWKIYEDVHFVFSTTLENRLDLSELVKDDYVLEFYLKNNNPSLTLDIKFSSYTSLDPNWSDFTYTYFYKVENENVLGEWQRVVIPLKDFVDFTDKAKNYWSLINHLSFQISSEGGQDFYLDEIRVRKAIN